MSKYPIQGLSGKTTALIESLRKKGVKGEIISSAMAEAQSPATNA